MLVVSGPKDLFTCSPHAAPMNGSHAQTPGAMPGTPRTPLVMYARLLYSYISHAHTISCTTCCHCMHVMHALTDTHIHRRYSSVPKLLRHKSNHVRIAHTTYVMFISHHDHARIVSHTYVMFISHHDHDHIVSHTYVMFKLHHDHAAYHTTHHDHGMTLTHVTYSSYNQDDTKQVSMIS
jgi:hypothetical protein